MMIEYINSNLDNINACLQIIGAILVSHSAFKCYSNKSAAGVSFLMTGFFFILGVWNLIFFAGLDQMLSFAGGLLLVTANMIYTGLIIKYSFWKEK